MYTTAYITKGKKTTPVTILRIPIDEETELYIVQTKESDDILEVKSDELSDHDPTIVPTDTLQPLNGLYPWVKDKAKVTLFLSGQWTKTQQGHL